MGCDIHWRFQRRNPDASCTSNPWVDVKTTYEGRRHYYLFGVLSDTRNYYEVEPISQPKGLPSDLRLNLDEFTVDGSYLGDHSFSWLSGDEMLSWYDSKEPCSYNVSGGLTKDQYSKWDKVSEPASWCFKDPTDPGTVTQSELEAGLVTKDYTHVHATWVYDNKPDLAYFFEEVRRLKELYGEVRFVFGFNS